MTKEEIGNVLKQLRISSGKTQKEVAEILGRTQQIIGHWETGYSQPDANTLFTLCDIYNTTVDDAFGFKKNIEFTPVEKLLIKKYRSLDPCGKETVNYLLDRESSRSQQSQEQLDRIASLEVMLADISPETPRSSSPYDEAPPTPEELEAQFPPEEKPLRGIG